MEHVEKTRYEIGYISSDFCLSMFCLKLSNITALFQLWQPYNDIYGKWIKGCFQKQLEALVNGDAENHVLVRGKDMVNVLKFRTLFSFRSQICCFLRLDSQNACQNSKQGRG